MTTEWTTVPFGEVVTLAQGLCFNAKTNHLMAEAGIPLLRIGDLINGTQTKFVDATKVPKKYIANPQDIIFTRTGQVGLVFKGKIGVVHNNCFRVIPQSGIEPNYLYWYLRQSSVIEKARSLASGAAQPDLGHDAFKSILFTYPELRIQQRIAGILSAYDELIENSQRRIKILETMARTLYREWFVHFRFPGSENHPRVASALGEIPQGWEVKKLKSLMENHIGGGWGKDVADDDHTQPAWVIRGTDIPAARSSQVTGVPHRFHTVSNLRSRKLAVGDILFEVSGGSKGQPVGRTLIITTELLSTLGGDVICASFCKRVRPKADDYGSELLYLSFLEGYESGEIEQYQVQSTGISNFKWTDYIANIERVIPPAPLRSQFRSIVAPLFSQIATVGLTIQNLRRTRDLLLPRLLSGQIDVNPMETTQ